MLKEHGVEATAFTDDSGTLQITLSTDRAVRVTLNGELLRTATGDEPRGPGPRASYWGPDGKQTTERQVDLSGAGGLADAIRRGG
jgi:hypothetical protein